MPGCSVAGFSLASGPDRGGPRCAVIEARAFGIPFTASVGGAALAEFPEHADVESAFLPTGQAIPLQWRDAVFYGRHWLLGPILIRLIPEHALKLSTSSFVQSMGAGSFFPA